MSAETYLDALAAAPHAQAVTAVDGPTVEERLDHMAQQLDWLCTQVYGMSQAAQQMMSGGGFKALMGMRKGARDAED